MRSDRLLLRDMIDAMETIRACAPATRAEFDANPPLQSHIYRHLMIVGEAAHRMSKELKLAHPEVPWRRAEGMRHILVHDYFKVNWDMVYDTALNDLPTLRPQISQILQSA